jgi:hypothetical protein
MAAPLPSSSATSPREAINPPENCQEISGFVILSPCSSLIGDIESDRCSTELAEVRGSPVLLRQYLKLNAELLGFNVDPDFGDVLDGLMLVDLAQVQRAILVRYMGRENATRFLAYHGIS